MTNDQKKQLEALTRSDILNLKIFLPKIEEQEKIAKFLGECDRILTLLRRKRELLESYKRGVMQLLFTQKIRFKNDDGSDFPAWEVKNVGKVFKWIRTNSLSREHLSYDSGTIQNIHYGDIHKKFRCQFKLNQENVPYINNLNLLPNLEEDDFCKVGDIVIADASEDYADIGKAIEIIEVEPNKLVAGLHCFIARPKTKIIVGYSGYLFQSNYVRQQIKNIAQGISVLGISKSNLEKINIPYPSLEEQEKIAQFLTAIDKKIAAVGRQIEGRGKFKQGLLQKMFI